MSNGERTIAECPRGELREGLPWALVADVAVPAWVEPCAHADQRRVPVAVVAWNEAGYRSTALCAACVRDALAGGAPHQAGRWRWLRHLQRWWRTA